MKAQQGLCLDSSFRGIARKKPATTGIHTLSSVTKEHHDGFLPRLAGAFHHYPNTDFRRSTDIQSFHNILTSLSSTAQPLDGHDVLWHRPIPIDFRQTDSVHHLGKQTCPGRTNTLYNLRRNAAAPGNYIRLVQRPRGYSNVGDFQRHPLNLKIWWLPNSRPPNAVVGREEKWNGRGRLTLQNDTRPNGRGSLRAMPGSLPRSAASAPWDSADETDNPSVDESATARHRAVQSVCAWNRDRRLAPQKSRPACRDASGR